jgi:hypothetical protein
MTGTRSRSRPHRAGRPTADPAAPLAGDLATASPGVWIRATPVAFYGRTAHAADSRDSQADRHRQLILCRAVIAAYGGQVVVEYFDEGCRADRPWHSRPQGQALLAALSGPARQARALVAADPWCLLPRRRPPVGGAGILQQLALRRVLLVLADTGISVLTAGEYDLLGRVMSAPAGRAPLAGRVAWPSVRDRRPRGMQPDGRAAAGQFLSSELG